MFSFATTYDFDPTVVIELLDPDGARVPVAVNGLDVDPGAVLRVTMAPTDVAQVVKRGLFGLADETGEVDWDPGVEVDVTLHLVAELAGPERIGDGEPLLVELAGDDESSPFRSTASWLLGEALQRLEFPGDPSADVQIGLRTRWAGPGAGGFPAGR
jgi:hypothetical protein